MTAAYWLIDKSALARADKPTVGEVLLDEAQRGRIGVSILTELEMGFWARSKGDYDTARERLLDRLIAVPLSQRAEDRAREVQAELVLRGQHRSAGVADLLIAATAEVERLVLLHYDADFDLIADITGQPTKWVVPRGTGD